MKDLAKELYFTTEKETNVRELAELASMILDTEFTIDIYTSRKAFVIRPSDLGWTFEFNTRKQAIGLCNYDDKKIFLSKWFVDQNLDKPGEFEDVIRHEVAHLIDREMGNSSNHGRVWKAIARKVLANPSRTKDGLSISQDKCKYSLVCKNCGAETGKHKKIKREYACTPCCKMYNYGVFTREYLLTLRKNY